MRKLWWFMLSASVGMVVAALVGRGAPEAHAAPLRPAQVPAALRPWVPWALRGHEAQRCPTIDDEGNNVVCAWAGPLTLAVNGKGGQFVQDWQLLAPTFVPLPGDAKHWPLDVKAGGKGVAVVPRDEIPSVELPAGTYRLTGVFEWGELPEALSVTSQIGVVALTTSGRRVAFPRRTTDGELYLQKEAAPAETDSLRIVAHRKLTDAVPMLLTTRLTLEVAGKAREVTLGRSLPAGFVAHALESALPARIDDDGRLRLQVRAGTWTVTLTGRRVDGGGAAGPVRFTRPAPDGPWQDGDEVWVFEANPALRATTIDGVPTVDARQTTLPAEWRSLPAYLVGPQATLSLVEQRRGDAQPAADQLTLERTLWLDFDGGGFTANDSITGVFRRGWRLDMGPSQELGRVVMDGGDQFITRAPDGGGAVAAGGGGIEIRQGSASIVAASRIEGAARSLSVVGWNHDFQSVTATLALPPGWTLLHASGADGVSQSWLRDWSLLELFLVLVVALAAGKLFGVRAGVVALLALGLSVTQPEAPQWLWLAVLVAEALVRVLGKTKVAFWAWLTRLGVWLALLLVAVPFAVHELRVGLFPAQADVTTSGERFSLLLNQSPAAAPTAADAGHKFGKAKAASSATEDKAVPAYGIGGLQAPGRRRMFARDSAVGADSGDAVNGLLSASGSGAGRAADVAGKIVDKEEQLSGYDPSVVAQTGPGLPRWNWTRVALSWSGPVDPSQRLSLWLLSPLAALVLAFVRVALLAALLIFLLWPARGMLARLLGTAASAAVLLAGLSLLGGARVQAAEFPPDPLLEQLRDGLLEKPTCGSDCVSLGRLALEAAPDRLRLRCEISAAADTVVALPGHRDHWTPAVVLVDGKATTALAGDQEGTLWLRVAAGRHQVILDGPLPARTTVQLPLPEKPHVIAQALRGWRLAGVGDDGEIDDTLQLSRETGAGARPAGGAEAGAGALAGSSLPAFVTVERTLRLGVKWQVETVVRRATPAGAAAAIDVPLLPGESPLGEGLRISQGRAQVTLGPDDTETRWTSVLNQRPTLELQAPPASGLAFTEVWRLELGPLWHADVSGIPPILEGDAVHQRQWRPWPGEKVSLKITRPSGSDGQTLTLDKVDLTYRPGTRQTAVDVRIELRASRGGQHVVTLPTGATLESLWIDGAAQPLRQDGDKVTFPLHPGAQVVALTYRDAGGLGALFATRAPELGAPSTNINVTIDLPGDRWVLLLGGPRLGPSVLVWSTLLVLLLVAAGLGRSPLTPLRLRHWILLGLGLSQMPIAFAALVAGFLLALGLRRRMAVADPWVFDLRQVALALWAVVAVMLLFVAVHEGLLSAPDMHIAGNDSSATHLMWASDRAPGAAPIAWVLSTPLLVYRLAMLAWALWLAVALIRWSRWGWACFVADGLWRPLSKPAVPPV